MMDYIDLLNLHSYLSMAKDEFKRRESLLTGESSSLCRKEIERIETLQKKILDEIGERLDEKR